MRVRQHSVGDHHHALGAHGRRPGTRAARCIAAGSPRDNRTKGGSTTLSPRRIRVVTLLSAFMLATVPALAPTALAADALSLTTPFPAVSVSPGNRVTF